MKSKEPPPEAQTPPPLLLDVKELGRRLSIKPCTLYAWARRGQIPHYRLGELVRFNLDEVKTWIAERAFPGGIEK